MILDWSETAAAQLAAARDYIAKTSPAYADLLAERVIQRTEHLVDQPFTGAEVAEYGDERLREVYEHPYRILYRLDGDRVQVVSVIHSARQMPPNPPG
jgi:toxin ParE1/3/4